MPDSADNTKEMEMAGPPDGSGFSAFLVAGGFLDGSSIERAHRAAEASGEPFELVLTRLALIPEEQLADRLAEYWRLPRLGGERWPDDPIEIPEVEPAFFHYARLLPVAEDGDGYLFATDQPFRQEVFASLSFALDRPLKRAVCAPGPWDRAFARLYNDPLVGSPSLATDVPQDDEFDADRLRDIASEAPVVRLVAQIVANAVEARASDVHFQPNAHHVEVRLRVDGELRLARTLPLQLRAAVTSRLKIMARLDISERRLPQDGRTRVAVRGIDVDIRVSTLPTPHGESVVLRILDRSRVKLDFAHLGFAPKAIDAIRQLVAKPHGIVLVTGPTGSGKTTTLYTALGELNAEALKIVTVEDPVEYQLQGVVQVQAQPQIGLDFPAALRAILRQDPDVVMIGEIRDFETAQIAIQASLTGHLVLSTVHTNSAAATVMRLVDMGVEDFLLASTLQGVLAQRLVRRLCMYCAQPHADAELWRTKLNAPPEATVLQAKGCSHCGGSGYFGRRVISEFMTVTPALRQAIVRGRSEQSVFECAQAEGFRTLYEDGIEAVCRGDTTIDEVLRATESL